MERKRSQGSISVQLREEEFEAAKVLDSHEGSHATGELELGQRGGEREMR